MERFEDGPHNYGEIGADLGFPEAQDRPAHLVQPPVVLAIPLDVPLDLGQPVCGVVPSAQLLPPALPVTPVPEVAVAEDGDLRSEEGDVGASRQSRNVLPIPAARGPEGPAEHHLASGVRLLAAPPSRQRGMGRRRGKALVAGAHRLGGRWRVGCFGRQAAHGEILPEKLLFEEGVSYNLWGHRTPRPHLIESIGSL